MKKPETKLPVQQARAALEQGDKAQAKELALLATADPVQAEQAWLILASLSDKQQALLYVENALKVNPKSQAARKAVRLIYSQMASEKAKAENEEDVRGPAMPPEAPIQALDDTAPIPVEKDTPDTEVTASDETRETPPAASASISTGALRAKLRQRGSATTEEVEEIEEADSLPQAAAAAKSAPKKKGLFARKAQADVEPEEDATAIPAEAVEEHDEEPASPENFEQADEPPASPEVIELSDEPQAAAPTEEAPAAEPAPPATSEQADALENAATAEEAPAAESAPQAKAVKEPVEEVPNSAAPRKMGVDLPNGNNNNKESIVADKLETHNGKSEPANVDTIELVLVSVSAILIPLLVFLYFYLTK